MCGQCLLEVCFWATEQCQWCGYHTQGYRLTLVHLQVWCIPVLDVTLVTVEWFMASESLLLIANYVMVVEVICRAKACQGNVCTSLVGGVCSSSSLYSYRSQAYCISASNACMPIFNILSTLSS